MPRHAPHLLYAMLLFSIASPTRAQIKTDGSVGARQTLTGPAFAIPATLGRQVGGNLFHSFADFNIQAGESATFTGPGSVQNVLSRVTGGSISSINGALRCDIPGANLYLMNPAGVVFGPGATLDVSGSFAVTSADSIRLGRRDRFNAAPAASEVLTSASPTAFGFLARGNGAVSVTGSQLAVAAGRSLSVVANGGIRLSSSAVLNAPAGRVNLVAAAGAGQVGLRADRVDAPIDTSATALGNVSIEGNSGVDTSGDGGGPIIVRAKDFTVTGASGLLSNTTGATAGRRVDVSVAGDVLLDTSLINVGTAGVANAGAVEIAAANRITLSNGALLLASTGGAARGGRISLTGHNVRIDGANTLVASSPTAGTSGAGGDIAIAATHLSVANGASVVATTFGDGPAGDLTVGARDLTVHGLDPTDINTGLLAGSAAGASGAGGQMTIRAGSIRVENGGKIGGNTTGAGPGASLHLTADTLTLTGAGTSLEAGSVAPGAGGAGQIQLDLDSLTITDGARIFAATLGDNAGGRVLINTGALAITRSGTINAGTAGAGDGGDVEINASRSVFMRGDNAGIIASTSATPGGTAGRISVTTPSLTLRDGAGVATGTGGSGSGGSITITGGDVSLQRAAVIGNVAGATSTGDGGDIAIRARSLSITDGSVVAATLFGAGAKGGAIDLSADRIFIRGAAGDVTGIIGGSDPGTTGAPGDITIRRSGSITLENSATIGAVTQGSGAGGRLSVDAASLTLHGPNTLLAASTAGSGAGGTMTLNAPLISLRNGANISVATSGSGRGGDLTINTRTLDMAGADTRIVAGATAAGSGGSVSITAHDVTLGDRAILSVATIGAGDGGSLSLNTTSLKMDGAGTLILATTTDTGAGGSVSLNLDRVSLTRGAVISAETEGPGPGGMIDITARSALSLTGTQSAILADTMAAQNGGPAGTLHITAGQLSVTDGAFIFAGTLGSGTGGTATIDAHRVFLRGLPGDSVDDLSTLIGAGSLGGTGPGGRLVVNADRVRVSRGAAITVGTAGPGNGGDARVRARYVLLDNGNIVAGSQPADPTDPPATGFAGSVSVGAAKSIDLRNNSTIGAKADAASGGNISLAAPRITLRNSALSGQAGQTGGSINVSARDLVYLFQSQINAVGQQSLGSVNIDPIFTILDQSTIMTTADIAGGNINLRTDRFFKSSDSVITAARNATVNLTIYTPNANITGSLVPVNAPLIDSSASFIEECSRRLQVDLSSFLVTGRGAQPLEPGGLNPTFDLRNPSTAR